MDKPALVHEVFDQARTRHLLQMYANSEPLPEQGRPRRDSSGGPNWPPERAISSSG